jgi:hypothetical protein
MRWYELKAANGPKIKGDGAVWTPCVVDNHGTPGVMIQPGRGVTERPSPIVADMIDAAPNSNTSPYARELGATPGPEWVVNGRPYSTTWTITLRRNKAGELDPYVEHNRFDEVTDAARRAITEWLTSAEVLAEVTDPRAHALGRLESARVGTHYAREEAARYSLALSQAEHREAVAREALRAVEAEAVADKIGGNN